MDGDRTLVLDDSNKTPICMPKTTNRARQVLGETLRDVNSKCVELSERHERHVTRANHHSERTGSRTQRCAQRVAWCGLDGRHENRNVVFIVKTPVPVLAGRRTPSWTVLPDIEDAFIDLLPVKKLSDRNDEGSDTKSSNVRPRNECLC